ncbi:hypothetical protein Tco_1082841 [Tanacetum coccineum]|uniref:Uncharacterized protein n=1 Tax=Tanacetum coccineum TaxID=301880 RepID=A0ABQ5I1I3_9ASTR
MRLESPPSSGFVDGQRFLSDPGRLFLLVDLTAPILMVHISYIGLESIQYQRLHDSGSSTRDVSPRLGYPPRRAPRRSEAFRHWCAAPLSTLSLVDFVPSSTPFIISLAPTMLYHLPTDPKRDVKDDTEEYEADASVGDTVEAEQLIAGDIELVWSTKDGQIFEEFRQVHRDRDDTRKRLRRTMTITRSGMTPAAIEEMINQRGDAALEARRVNRDLKLGNGNDNGGGYGNGYGNV